MALKEKPGLVLKMFVLLRSLEALFFFAFISSVSW